MLSGLDELVYGDWYEDEEDEMGTRELDKDRRWSTEGADVRDLDRNDIFHTFVNKA